MSVVAGDGVIRLEGPCRVEDAETLVTSLQRMPGSAVDMTSCQALHAAVVQVLLAFRPPLTGQPTEPFLADWLLPAVSPETVRGGQDITTEDLK